VRAKRSHPFQARKSPQNSNLADKCPQRGSEKVAGEEKSMMKHIVRRFVSTFDSGLNPIETQALEEREVFTEKDPNDLYDVIAENGPKTKQILSLLDLAKLKTCQYAIFGLVVRTPLAADRERFRVLTSYEMTFNGGSENNIPIVRGKAKRNAAERFMPKHYAYASIRETPDNYEDQSN